MKKRFAVRVAAALAVMMVSSALAYEPTGKIGISARVTGVAPTNGDFTAGLATNDVFDVGPSFGGQVSYTPIKYLSIVGGFDYGWLAIKDEFKPRTGMEPNLQLPVAFLRGQFNFGSLIHTKDNRINPYVSAVAGIYPWKVTTDGINGDAQRFSNGEEFKKTSFGLQSSAGVEVFILDQLSVFAEGTYHFVFAEDKNEFVGATNSGFTGFNGFDDNGLVTFGGGVTFYLPVGK